MKVYFKPAIVIFITLFAFIFSPNFKKVIAIPPKNLKDVLSNSQFSYYGGVGVGNSAGDTLIKLDISTSFPSRTSNNLFVGDTISIGIGGSQSTYSIKDIGNTAQIIINTGINANAITEGGSIIATRSAIHTVSFEPQVNATGGFWQVLIKASNTGTEKFNDGIPDQYGFDIGQTGTSYGIGSSNAITCPWSASPSIGTTMAVDIGSPAVTSYYNIIQCALPAGGTNPAGTGATGTIVIGVGNSMLINPSPSHTAAAEGTADTFTYILRHLDSAGVLLDQTVGKIAVVEAVRVTATIDPTLTFTIDNSGAISAGSTACGTGTSLAAAASSTTGDQVIFGSLAIGTTGNQLAQRLSCVTNALGGYVITAYENSTMENISTGTTITDTACNGNGCSYTTAAAWTSASTTKSEFGYTMNTLGGGSSIPFVQGNFKAFGQGPTQAQEIMKRITTPTSTEFAYVCYRITATTIQEAGDYEAKIVYTATATF